MCLLGLWQQGFAPGVASSQWEPLVAFKCARAQGSARIRTLRITTLRRSPFSLRPSGLAESPLLRIGLALRLFAAELAVEVAEVDLRRLGMMRTILAVARPSVDVVAFCAAATRAKSGMRIGPRACRRAGSFIGTPQSLAMRCVRSLPGACCLCCPGALGCQASRADSRVCQGGQQL
jgi:hypothetical protein